MNRRPGTAWNETTTAIDWTPGSMRRPYWQTQSVCLSQWILLSRQRVAQCISVSCHKIYLVWWIQREWEEWPMQAGEQYNETNACEMLKCVSSPADYRNHARGRATVLNYNNLYLSLIWLQASEGIMSKLYIILLLKDRKTSKLWDKN